MHPPEEIVTAVRLRLMEPLIAALNGQIDPQRLEPLYGHVTARRIAIASRKAPGLTGIRTLIVQADTGSLEVATVVDNDHRSFAICCRVRRRRGQLAVDGFKAPDLVGR